MAYVMGFGFSPYNASVMRCKKPFNPLLGETYEYVDEVKKYKFIAE
jgi:hypothetical protein